MPVSITSLMTRCTTRGWIKRILIHQIANMCGSSPQEHHLSVGFCNTPRPCPYQLFVQSHVAMSLQARKVWHAFKRERESKVEKVKLKEERKKARKKRRAKACRGTRLLKQIQQYKTYVHVQVWMCKSMS